MHNGSTGMHEQHTSQVKVFYNCALDSLKLLSIKSGPMQSHENLTIEWRL